MVSAANSLVGSTAFDIVGVGGATALTDGNYVVVSGVWHNGGLGNAGAVTWSNGTNGQTVDGSHTISAANSLIGGKANDNVGNTGDIAVLPGGKYVVASPHWDNGALADAGAVTWAAAGGATVGVVSTANSLLRWRIALYKFKNSEHKSLSLSVAATFYAAKLSAEQVISRDIPPIIWGCWLL